ncbi:ATP-binding protein [Geothrix sp. 21YS21S-2]|uniref:ATP-binding protein n=1 Tax=Geothrix sp. 21YS21S-2 TaxID=3068893 RepID=UPI0027B9FD45|nr:ATP-binding protein [Geothrix sp. 21YS21S-2]
MNRFTLHAPGHPPFLLGRERAELVLGRAPGVDILLQDAAISRRHARFAWKEDGVWLEDLGSRHGSFRNGARVNAPVRVAPGDRITLGPLELRLEPAAPAALEETSLALEDVRLWAGAQEGLLNWREALELLHELSLMMLKDLEPGRLLGDLLDRLFTFLGASRGAVLLKDAHGALVPVAVRAQDPDSPLGLPTSTLEATISRRAARLFREPAVPDGLLAESRTASAMAVPLEFDGRTLGLFYFDSNRGRGPFTELDLRFVASLCNLAAAKLLQQTLAAELRDREERERELRAREAQAQARSEFLARMSHEIRTPMNAVLGFTRLARAEALPPRAEDCLRKIDLSGRSLMAVVDEILDFSKMEAGKVSLEALPFRVQDVLADIRDLFSQAALEKGLALEVASVELPPVVGDAHRLTQVLANLVGNAVKFTTAGSVAVRVEAGQGPLLFSVADTGIGIAPDQAERLFSPYAQADESIARRYGGTGLGLSIASRLVELMGGTLAVASEPGAGSTFSFSLELAPAESADLRGRRVLLVEDNALNRELAEALLREAGAEVDTAGTGEAALDRAREAPYDAVLMDLHLPGMDGFEAARRLGALGLGLPILAMTAEAGARQRCLEAGMAACLPKPLEARNLLEALALRARPDPLEALSGVLDLPRALARAGGRRDLLANFMKGFLDEPILPAHLREAAARGDLAGARRLAHDLRGLAGNLGLDAAGAAAAYLEDLPDSAGPEWQEACARLEEALAPFLARGPQAFRRGAP